MAEKSRNEVIKQALALNIEVTPEDLTSEIQQKIYQEYERRAKENERIEERSHYIANNLVRVKVTQDELDMLQETGKLVGYDPATKEAVVKGAIYRKLRPETPAPEAPALSLPAEEEDPNPVEAPAKKKSSGKK